jgi:hypothetical protein
MIGWFTSALHRNGNIHSPFTNAYSRFVCGGPQAEAPYSETGCFIHAQLSAKGQPPEMIQDEAGERVRHPQYGIFIREINSFHDI